MSRAVVQENVESIDRVDRAAESIKHATSEATARGHAALDRFAGRIEKGTDSVAERVHGTVEALSEATGSAREKVSAIGEKVSAIGEKSFADVAHDAQKLLARHPGKAVIAALVVGFLVGFRRR